MVESIPFVYLPQALGLRPGVTAVIGSGGKTSLLATLARQLAARGETAVLTTSTRIRPFAGAPLCTGADLAGLSELAAGAGAVCVGTPAENGKLAAPARPFYELARAVGYVLVEADGSKHLPLKAHAAHEPVIPTEAQRTVLVVGATGFGKPVAEVAHRPELFCQRAGCEPQDAATPARVTRVLVAEGWYAREDACVLVNQVDTAERLAAARELQMLLHLPLYAASLQNCTLWRIA